MAYSYPSMVAFNPGTNTVVRNTVFQVYATTDTSYASPLPITDTVGNALANLNSGALGVFPSFQQAQYTTVVVSDVPNHTYAWTVPAALTTAVLQWAANTYYAAGQPVVNPSGNVVTANVNHTAGSSYNPANWTVPNTYTGSPGLLWAFGGDSITNGSSASNFAYSYSAKAAQHVGSLVARYDFISSGKPGDNSAGLLSRMPTILAAGPQAFVILIGTNDAGQGVSLATYTANIKAIVSTAQKAGCPVVLCTVPPRGASTAASIQNLVAAYNVWIRNYGPSLGVTIADVNSVLVDPTTGSMNSAYDSGDGTHPNDTGHNLVASVVGPAMIKAANAVTPRGLIRTGGTPSIQNLVQDPLATLGTTQPSGWFEQPGGTGTAPTYSLVSDTSGVLPAGKWAQMDFDGTASGGLRRLATNSLPTASWAVGDLLLMTAHIQIEDTSGTWVADAIAGNAGIGPVLVNQSGVGITSPFNRPTGRLNAQGFYDIGPLVWPVTVPSGTTGLNVWFGLTVPTGKHYKMRIGNPGVINLTQLGLASLYPWGNSPVFVANS